MGERENTIEIARALVERASRKLKSARILLDSGFFDDAISRAYYAAFLASRAVLLLLGEKPHSHTGVLTLFGLKVVKTGLVHQNYAKTLTALFEARQASDYSPLVWYEKEETRDHVAKAEQFVEKMSEVIGTLK